MPSAAEPPANARPAIGPAAPRDGDRRCRSRHRWRYRPGVRRRDGRPPGTDDDLASLVGAPTGRIRVLHVDDDAAFLSLSAAALDCHDLDVATGTGVEGALARLDDRGTSVDCVVSDYDMPGDDGLAFLAAVRERDPRLPFVPFTGRGSEEVAGEALAAGASDYLPKGGGGLDRFEVLANRIERLVGSYRRARELRAARRPRERVLDASPVGIVVHDVDGDAVLRNDRALEILDASAPDLDADAYDADAYDAAGWSLVHLDGTPVEAAASPYRRVIDADAPVHDDRTGSSSTTGARSPSPATAPRSATTTASSSAR